MVVCIFTECNKLARFNTLEQKNALYCFQHKKENMINIKKTTCIESNCITQPIFNTKEELIAMLDSKYLTSNKLLE